MMIMNENKYYYQLDILKGLAIISVIILHTIPIYLIKTPIIVFSILTAVPVFFFIMGLNSSMSFRRKNYFELDQLYSKSYFKGRFKRLIVPFIIIFFISLILGILLKKTIYLGLMIFIGYLPLSGPGNYFISIVFQFVIIFPLIYYIYQKNPKLILALSFILSLLFELFANNISILMNNSFLYASSILRYLFIIVLGIWASENFRIDNFSSLIRKNFVILGLFMSITYLIIVSIFKYKLIIFQQAWQPQIVLSFFYPFILCTFALSYLPSNSLNKVSQIIGSLGRASYHIFLVQILFFGSGISLYKFFIYLGLLNSLNWYLIAIIILIINIIISTVLGYLFYLFDKRIIQSQF
ncbi:MAG: hypothetical protein CVV28_10440 [Methanobacteriales archaeon HGW-Methanobacteriales-1]|jgi:peptidoglycan/LPS O-acetylase OafA/YrhL|nr:MAG: hypothetical protein CVV28_10440 [Methanobacteriales archaeon HGW-Methanobacteriales-1]